MNDMLIIRLKIKQKKCKKAEGQLILLKAKKNSQHLGYLLTRAHEPFGGATAYKEQRAGRRTFA